jgi:hypothetical protein
LYFTAEFPAAKVYRKFWSELREAVPQEEEVADIIKEIISIMFIHGL